MITKRLIRHISKQIAAQISLPEYPRNETEILALGKLLCNQQRLISSDNIHDYEFKIFSQWGEDGIIQYLVNNIKIENKIFVEFGVEDYHEANTRFLMMNNNWRGLVIDGSEENIANVKRQEWFWKYDLEATCAFIDCDNINNLLDNYRNIGILSIDIDGNDYHVMNAIDFNKVNPSILIVEYNSVFGKDRKITIPYDKNFYRTIAHYSNLYFGASLPALTDLAKQKGYALIGCCSNGANAFFVRKDLLNETVKEKSVSESYVESKFRESRNANGLLTFVSREKRLSVVKGMPILNIENKKIEEL